MRTLALAPFLCAVAALSGCANTANINPQTRDEFRQMKLSGSPFALVDTHVVNRPLGNVVAALRKKVDECFQVNVTTTRGYAMRQTDEYRTTIRLVDKNHAELTTQFYMKGAIVLQKVPPGGFYNTAMDIERLTPSTTKLTYYGASTRAGKLKWNLLKDWSAGQSTPCPT